MQEKILQLERELEELKNWKASMEASHSIPLNIDQSFRARFPSTPIKSSAKGVNSEDQSVNEGGAATYNVPKEYDAFLEVEVNGAVYYIGVYTALT